MPITSVYSHRANQIKAASFEDKLPKEMFIEIFSFLDPFILQFMSIKSTYWNNVSVIAGKFRELDKVKAFTFFLIKKLDDNQYPEEKKQLLKIANSTNILNSSNLLKVKLSLLTLKHRIMHVFRNLTETDFSDLNALAKNIDKPNFFDDIFEESIKLRELYKKANPIIEESNEDKKNEALEDLCIKLTEFGSFEEAIQTANTLTSQGKKIKTLGKIFKCLLQSDYFNLAIQVLKMIPKEFLGTAVEETFGFLIQRGFIYTAISSAIKSFHQREQGKSYEEIFNRLIGIGSFDIITQMALTISEKHKQIENLKNFSKKLARMDSFQKAIKVAMKIPDKEERNKALWYIFELLKGDGKFDKAIELAIKMPEKYLKDRAFEIIFHRLVKTSNQDTANELAMKIPDKEERNKALWYIFELLKGDGKFDKAIELAIKMPEKYLKDRALEMIFHRLVKTSDQDTANELAMKIPDKEERNKALWYIFELLKGDGKFDKAIELAMKMPDENLKSCALSYFKVYHSPSL